MKPLTNEEIDCGVRAYRLPIPEECVDALASLNAAQLRSPPYTTLLSYLAADYDMSADALAHVLRNPDRFAALAGRMATLLAHPPKPPSYNAYVFPSDPASIIAAAIRVRSSRFTYGNADALLVAEYEDCAYRYPNGDVVPYRLLVRERSANFDALTFGFHVYDGVPAYIRDVSVRSMAAFAHIPPYTAKAQDSSLLAPHFLGIMIAHEEGHASQDRAATNHVELELDAWRTAHAMLVYRRVPHEAITLFHRIRALPVETSVSRSVLLEEGAQHLVA